jgi:hypothetical protein
VEIHKTLDGSELAVVAATWELNPRVSFQSLSAELRANPQKFWRNFGSRVGAGATNLAIKDPQQVIQHINLSRTDPWNYVHNRFFEHIRGVPDRRYFMHFDLAKNKDTAGVACVHREPTGVVVVDFMYGHRAEPGKTIIFAELRQYLYDLHVRGFVIVKATYDQWQSEETRQILEGQGFATDQCSADRTTGPYDTLIEMLLTDRLDYYNYAQFIREMQQLRSDGIKYDHPKHGTKDVSDAVACATWTAINDSLENPVEAPGVLVVHRSKDSRYWQPRYERSQW